jgi:acetate CoA/acetoacetate CoA-transferase beta subunit
VCRKVCDGTLPHHLFGQRQHHLESAPIGRGAFDPIAVVANSYDAQGRLANWMIPGMGGAMDLMTGGKRVIVAMQHTAKGRPKFVKTCMLPLTSVRPLDLVVTEMAVIDFANGHATLLATAPGVSVAEVVRATDADLKISDKVPETRL